MNSSKRLKPKWKDLSIDIDWGTLRAKQYGSGSNKMLAIHGLKDNANSYDLIIPYLDEDLTVVCLDLPGHGWSAHMPPGFVYDLISYTMVLKKVIKKLKWNTFTLMAHSLGVGIAIRYAAFFPEDVEAYIAIDMIYDAYLTPDECIDKYRKDISHYLKVEKRKTELESRQYDKETLVGLMRMIGRTYEGVSPEVILERGSIPASGDQSSVTLTLDPRIDVFFRKVPRSSFHLACARSIVCPVLLINASRGYETDPSAFANMKDVYEEGCKLFRFERIEGDHHLHLSNPEAVGPVISQFIRDAVQLSCSKL